MNERTGVFAGLRIIDAGSFIAAPAAATIFSDFGADVIKIEPPGTGDPHRLMANQPQMPRAATNYFWTLEARNKRSLAVDLKQEEGREILEKLAGQADILITNMPLKVRCRLGLDYSTIQALNDRLIYASFTGYGESGEEMDKPGFDATAWWARSGMMDQVRNSADTPPGRAVPGMGDHMAALSIFGAITTALFRRERTGKGSYVSSSLLANGAWSNSCYLQAVLCGADIQNNPPRESASNPLSNFYRCRDGRWFILGISLAQETKSFDRFAEAIGHPELLSNPLFNTRDARHKNAPALTSFLDGVFAARDAGDWQQILGNAGFAVAPVAKIKDVVHDKQLLAADALVPIEGVESVTHTISSPFSIAGAEKIRARRPPQIGEHSDEILRELGLSDEAIAHLRHSRVVG